MRYALLGLLCAVPLNKIEEPTPKRNIDCAEKGHYIGGIDRVWNLRIGGLGKTWDYSFQGHKQIKGSGACELAGDLVIFTGKVDGAEVRFGLNYGFPNGTVEFNGFFPVNDKLLRYQRKWYRKVKDEWQPAEELTLEMARTPPNGMKAAVRGSVSTWDAQGKETRQDIADDIHYLRRPGDRIEAPAPLKGTRLVPSFGLMIPSGDGKLLDAVLPEYEWAGVRAYGKTVGIPREPCFMHGFHPALHKQLTEK